MPFPKPSRKQYPKFALSEFIGEKTIVRESSCRGLEGIEGTIKDETMNTFVISTLKGERRVPKKNSVFFFPEREVSLSGSDLLHRPEDRTKKLA